MVTDPRVCRHRDSCQEGRANGDAAFLSALGSGKVHAIVAAVMNAAAAASGDEAPQDAEGIQQALDRERSEMRELRRLMKGEHQHMVRGSASRLTGHDDEECEYDGDSVAVLSDDPEYGGCGSTARVE